MSVNRIPSRSLRAAVVAAAALTPGLAFGQVRAAAMPSAVGALAMPEARSFAQQLAQARAESDAAEAALSAAKQVLTPGHLLDPLPSRLLTGVGELQAQYAELERQAAGYRATLGDQHPTLKGAEEVLAELRGQILDGVRRAIAAAQQDAAQARAAVTALERRAQATGSIASAAVPQRATGVGNAVSIAAAAVPPPRGAAEGARAAATPSAGRSPTPARAAVPPPALPDFWIAVAAGPLAAGAALLTAVALVRSRRGHPPAPVPVRIEPTAGAEPVEPAAPPSPCQDAASLGATPPVTAAPVLGRLPIAAKDDLAAIRTRLACDPEDPLARGSAAVFATLAAAADAQARGRVSVLVTAAAGASDALADATALVLADAAAKAGRRVLLVDAHPDRRLGPALAPGTMPVALAEDAGRLRGVVRTTVGDRVLAVLTADAGEQTESAPARLPDLDGFDAIIRVGAPDDRADLALVVAPDGAAVEDLAVAAQAAAGDADRPCGILLVETTETATAAPEAPEASEAHAMPARTVARPARRRLGPEVAAARFGLRRTFDPARRVAKRAG